MKSLEFILKRFLRLRELFLLTSINSFIFIRNKINISETSRVIFINKSNFRRL